MELWNGFKIEKFVFEGFEAVIVFPEKEDEKRNWLLKTEYFGAFPEVEIKLIEKGFHLAYVTNISRFATEEDCHRKARFADYLSEKYGLRDRCVPVGMSCGGGHAVNFAGFHPEKVLCMYIDAPVLNFCDFPARPRWNDVWENEFVKAYPGIERYKLLGFHNHPLGKTDILIENRIPVLMVYGTEDDTVRYEINGALMEEAYGNHPGLLTVIPIPARGHHPHGMIGDNSPIVKYVIENSR